MRGVFALVLLVGMGLAGFAVYMVQGFVSQQETALAQERTKTARTVPTNQIYAPRRTITYGEPILPGDVTLIDYAIAFVPEGSFATLEEIFPDGEDVPRIALHQMEINEPILAIKVTQPGRDAGITSRLSRGMPPLQLRSKSTVVCPASCAQVIVLMCIGQGLLAMATVSRSPNSSSPALKSSQLIKLLTATEAVSA